MKVDTAVHSLAVQNIETAVDPAVKRQQDLQSLIDKATQQADEYPAAPTQTPTLTENAANSHGASTTKTSVAAILPKLSPAKQAVVNKTMQEPETYREEQGGEFFSL